MTEEFRKVLIVVTSFSVAFIIYCLMIPLLWLLFPITLGWSKSGINYITAHISMMATKGGLDYSAPLIKIVLDKDRLTIPDLAEGPARSRSKWFEVEILDPVDITHVFYFPIICSFGLAKAGKGLL